MLKPNVQLREIEGVLVAEFWNCLRLDPQPIQDLRDRFEAQVQGGGSPDLIINMSGVSFAGSMALARFLKLHRIASQNGGRLVFCQVEPEVFEVFRISRVDHLFCFVPDVDAALQWLQTRNAGPEPPRNEDDPPSSQTPPASPQSPPGGGTGGGGGGNSPISRVRQRLR